MPSREADARRTGLPPDEAQADAERVASESGRRPPPSPEAGEHDRER